MLSHDPDVRVYPNPFLTAVTFKMVSPITGRQSLDVCNTSGQKVGNAFNGVLQSNISVSTEFRLPKPEKGIMSFRMIANGRTVIGKIISIK